MRWWWWLLRVVEVVLLLAATLFLCDYLWWSHEVSSQTWSLYLTLGAIVLALVHTGVGWMG